MKVYKTVEVCETTIEAETIEEFYTKIDELKQNPPDDFKPTDKPFLVTWMCDKNDFDKMDSHCADSEGLEEN